MQSSLGKFSKTIKFWKFTSFLIAFLNFNNYAFVKFSFDFSMLGLLIFAF